ncbi:ribonuclease E/G [Anaerocolumna sedimenticola]|uniref:ribonuclease E/G n=1 Tax=Anaerocolumna sedimenticola TaxID=2696063 RepID=UPI002483B806|nr:ribonuclease E/G [Anaerocolumna sedimenticola]
MNHKLIITKLDNHIVSAVFAENDMLQVNLDKADKQSILGNIYIGKVKNIVKNINAAFVEITGGKMCYLAIEENPGPIYVKPKKTDRIVIGDEILVQISKEDVKTKAPVVTTNLNFTGKYVVLIHGKSTLGVSSKINDENERKRLKEIMKPFKQETYGFIIRTNAVNKPAERIQEEVTELIRQYEEIKEFGVHKTTFSLIYETPPGFICDIRDGFADKINEIQTDEPDLYEIFIPI